MNSSAINRPLATGVLQIINNVDDFSYTIFSRVVYPTIVTDGFGSYVNGTEPNINSGVGDIPTSIAGVVIDTNLFIPQVFNFSSVVTYNIIDIK